jgi:hypothetical protein
VKIHIGDETVDMAEMIDIDDKGYYILLETTARIFTFVGSEATLFRNVLREAVVKERRSPTQQQAVHINQVLLVGVVEWESELRYTPQGRPECRFLLRTDITIHGVLQSRWQHVVTTDALAEYCSEALKGSELVKVEGRVDARVYFDDAGKPHAETVIVAEQLQIV